MLSLLQCKYSQSIGENRTSDLLSKNQWESVKDTAHWNKSRSGNVQMLWSIQEKSFQCEKLPGKLIMKLQIWKASKRNYRIMQVASFQEKLQQYVSWKYKSQKTHINFKGGPR